MLEPTRFAELLKAEIGDGLQVGPRRFPITHVGQSRAADGFTTREFTLGNDDFYLVVEGPLASGDPSQCRAVLTHELAANEVRCQDRTGRTQYVAGVLRATDDAPQTVTYHGRTYRYFRRVDAQYRGGQRNCPRSTWDYEAHSRNLAVERWPQGEMAVYEGEVVRLETVLVLQDYRPNAQSAVGATGPISSGGVRSRIGVWIGVGMMVVGFLLLVS